MQPVSDLMSDPMLFSAPAHEGYKVLGGIVLYQKLGQGGMGAVYRGRHLRLGVDVAIKVMARQPNLPPEQAEDRVRRFLREAQVAAMIDHPGLVRVIDVNSEGDLYFLVMDYVDGESAGDRIKRKGRLGEEEALGICLGAAEGLAEAHRKRVVHRDIKPDNIMISKEGRVKVTDLGLAKAHSDDDDPNVPSSFTQTQSGMGTPYYMPPEQFRSARDVGPQADVWSLGVTLYQLLADELPWTDTSVFEMAAKIKSDPLPDPKSKVPTLSDGVCAIIKKAVEKSPADRYADCGEMAIALRGHLTTAQNSVDAFLADAEAGSTKKVEIGMPPPESGTLTIIGRSVLDIRPTDFVDADEHSISRWMVWGIPAIAAAVVFAIVMAVWAATSGSSGAEPAVAVSPRPEAEAIERMRKDLELASAAVDDTRLDDAEYRLRMMKTRPGTGMADPEVARLVDELEHRIAAEHSKEEDARKATEKKHADLLQQARAAQDAGRPKEALDLLQQAKAISDMPPLDEQIAVLQRAVSAEELIQLGKDFQKAHMLDKAADAFERAARDAKGDDRAKAILLLAEARKHTQLMELLETARKYADAKKWPEAWEVLDEARSLGIEDPELPQLLRDVAAELAPPKRSTGPLGIDLVLIEGGFFEMGSDNGRKDARPKHTVSIDPFYIARLETTSGQFNAFKRKAQVPSAGKHPAVGLAWQEAVEFCEYVSSLDAQRQRYRLPTEAEWEFAARGTSGRTYPWGDAAPTALHANLLGRDDGHDAAAPVGSFPGDATPEGVLDLTGNVAEWCSDWYGAYDPEERSNPRGPASGEYRVVRGSAFAYDLSKWSRADMRSAALPEKHADTLGFRVVRELSAGEVQFLKFSEGARDGE
jgi:serine/threonine protein kinase/formylglycine-generating enzyme required for sulfatase activity